MRRGDFTITLLPTSVHLTPHAPVRGVHIAICPPPHRRWRVEVGSWSWRVDG